eukprot:1376187-Prymnesium_polylepis.1
MGDWLDTGIKWDHLIGAYPTGVKVDHNVFLVEAHAATSRFAAAVLLTTATDSSLPASVYDELLHQIRQLGLRADSEGAPSTHAEAERFGEPW